MHIIGKTIDLKKISFEILVNLTNYDFKIIKIINDKYKDKEFQEIDNLIYEFNSGGLKISNWIEFKNFANKIISSYSGWIIFLGSTIFWYSFSFNKPLLSTSFLRVVLFFRAFFAILAAWS